MIPELLRAALLPVARTVDPDGEVEAPVPTNNPAHGDYQWNFAFRLAKATKQNPRALAEKLAPQIAHPGIRKVEVAGPGFVNLTLDDAWLARTVEAQVASDTLGVAQEGAGKTVILDYSSPNVAKRMHIGHMRSTHIGHALDRMHRAAGWHVVADNHIGDWGTPFGKLIVAWRKWRDEEAYRADGVGELERLYVKFNQESTPELEDEARAETAKLQRGDPENTALWQEFRRVSLAEFQQVYDRMGVRFDEMLGESAFQPYLDDTAKRLVDAGVAEESEGALIVREGNNVLVVRKKDGAATYGLTDIACVLYRMRRWDPARVVYVTDDRQQLHFKQVFAAARRLGVTTELTHVYFGMLVLPEGAMSTRKGNVIRLVDLLDEAVRRARAVVDEKAPELPEAERAAIAEAVGVDSVRYADLSQNPQTNVTFEWDRMLSLEGNTAPYLLYSHARAVSLLNKAGVSPDLAALAAEHPLERELLVAIARYPEAVAGALRRGSPNVLADALFDLANRFNRFYYELRVIQEGEVHRGRLALAEAARRALRHGLTLLGLHPLDRM